MRQERPPSRIDIAREIHAGFSLTPAAPADRSRKNVAEIGNVAANVATDPLIQSDDIRKRLP